MASKNAGAPFLDRWWWLLVLAVLALGYAELLDNPLMVDEVQHYEQVHRFVNFQWSMHPFVTVIPGYHLALTMMSFLTGWYSLAALRFFTLLFGLGAVLVFHMLALEFGHRPPGLRALQFLVFPVVFPYFFLIYTDVLSLLLVLLLVLFSTRKRYVSAGLFGLLACLVRQNNIVWVALAMLVSYVEAFGWRWRPVTVWLREFWASVATGMMFLIFVIFNGGVVFGDRTAHPSTGLYLTNMWFLLFLSFFLFLPLICAHRSDMVRLAGDLRFWLAALVVLVVFLFTFVVDHPYNLAWGDFYLRNRLLIFFSSTAVGKLAFFVPVGLATAFFAVVPLRRHWWLLYPATVLFLMPSWLVEQRYYIIPATLFLLARREETKAVEYLQLAWFGLGALAAYLVINSGFLFL